MNLGANQQEIIRHLFKTQPFSTLKLLGRIMSKLKWDEELKMVWAIVSIEDFVQSRTEPNDIAFILDKIQSNYEIGEIFLILYTTSSDKIKGVVKFSEPEKMKLLHNFENGALAGDLFEFEVDYGSLDETERYIIEKLRRTLK